MRDYLVRMKTLPSFYDVKFGKVKPRQWDMVVCTTDPDQAIDRARRATQLECGQLVIVTNVIELGLVTSDDFDTHDISPLDLDRPWYEQRIVAFDVETTGLDSEEGRIVEIAFSEYSLETKSFGDPVSYLIDDGVEISKEASAINGITSEMLDGAPEFGALMHEFKKHITPETILVAHNRGFDMKFLVSSVARVGYPYMYIPPCFCSMELSMRTPVGQRKHNLAAVAEALGLDGVNSHRAGDDAQLCGEAFIHLARQNETFRGLTTRGAIAFFDGVLEL